MDSSWRQPTPWERALLERLLAKPFPGHLLYLRQAQSAWVREVDEEKQLAFEVPADIPSVEGDAAQRRALLEGVYQDSDGTEVSLILHARNGRLRLLEKLKGTGRPVIDDTPEVNRVTVQFIKYQD